MGMGCGMTQGSARSKVSAENGFEPLLYPIFFFFFSVSWGWMRWAGGLGWREERAMKVGKESPGHLGTMWASLSLSHVHLFVVPSSGAPLLFQSLGFLTFQQKV